MIIVKKSIGDTTPIGSIITMGAISPGPDYLRCNGGNIDQVTYPDLFALIGSSTPNLNSAFPRASADPVKVNGFAFHDWTTGSPRAGVTSNSAGSHNHKIGEVYQVHVDFGGDNHRASWAHWITNETQSDIEPNHTHTITGGDGSTVPEFVRVSYWIRGK